ncbi:MAG: hypothetical protein AB7S26_18630 [Sandaracinaceae bacterium]
MPARPDPAVLRPLPFPAASVARLVWPATLVVVVLGVLAEIGDYELGLPPAIVEALSLSYEANVPTWLASALLLSCAAVLAAVARIAHVRDDRDRHGWLVLALMFVYLSIDETAQIHEHAAFFETSGVLTFSWVIPAAGVVLALGLAFLPFVRRLPDPTRRRFVIAGLVYVGGALGMELPLGWWADREGSDNLTYGLIDGVEESLELIGATMFLLAVWAHHDGLTVEHASLDRGDA